MRYMALLVFLVLLAARPALGQYDQNDVLVGLDSIGARVLLTWDEDIPLQEEATRARLQTVFELELRTHGIRVIPDAFVQLQLRLLTLYSRSSILYSTELDLVEWTVPIRYGTGGGGVLSHTWVGLDGVGSAGPDDLLGVLGERARESAQGFANAWLAANPR